MTTKRTAHLLIIDPQNDFCDLPDDYRPALPGAGRAAPALPVPGAHGDMLRLAGLIQRAGAGLNAISVTLDSHQHLDIAHPTFWQTAEGGPVSPFTQLSAEDVRAGHYLPRLPGAARERALAYLESLERQGRYRHMVWPIHCEIGSWGHNVHAALRSAYNGWEERTLNVVAKVVKGENPWTEHYSAVQAEVPDESDPSTLPNRSWLSALRQADRLYIAGEAGSHCVKATTEHLLAELTDQERAKVVLITDCMSPVAGFETAQQGFISDARQRGAKTATADEVEHELLANVA
jgi:nicotinamidase/pyrazinamidase